jgi:hypothetical protein
MPKYFYKQGSPNGIQTPTHWNLISRSMTAPPPVLALSSILPPTHCAFILRKKKKLARVSKVLLFQLSLSFF